MPRKPKHPEEARNTPKNDTAPAPEAVTCEVIPPSGGRRGRPSKRTPEIEAAIADCIRLGMTLPQTCDACGVSQTQFRNWRKHYRDFQELCRRAEAEAVKFNLSVIQAAAARTWQAAAWFLERKHPEQWGRTETLSLQTKREAIREAVQVTATGGRTAAQLKEMRQILNLPPDTNEATIEAAIEHAKGETLRCKMLETIGMPFTPEPFQGIPKESGPGLSAETLAKVEKMLFKVAPTRAERIEVMIEIQAKARQVAGKPPLSPSAAFELAARELDGGKCEAPGG